MLFNHVLQLLLPGHCWRRLALPLLYLYLRMLLCGVVLLCLFL
ncbi:hypothetical protein MtrunA17_Chr1g0168771 [Medicago truncatula]|uniref:Transmembrane protein n=1 Tax=Medicago truncatula TaxID=3880 RepID=A0A396JKD3_MEDTR|nr:hypothetical protein MtrunA17_Chr1g0168771 [Medicago truncatula]